MGHARLRGHHTRMWLWLDSFVPSIVDLTVPTFPVSHLSRKPRSLRCEPQQNLLENYPQFLVLLALSSVHRPVAGAIAGAIRLSGFIVYVIGYQVRTVELEKRVEFPGIDAERIYGRDFLGSLIKCKYIFLFCTPEILGYKFHFWKNQQCNDWLYVIMFILAVWEWRANGWGSHVLGACYLPFTPFFSLVYTAMISFQRSVDPSIHPSRLKFRSVRWIDIRWKVEEIFAESLSPFIYVLSRVAQTGNPAKRLNGGFGYLGLLGLVVMSTELSVRLLMSSA